MQRKITNLLKRLKEALYQIYGDNLSGVYLYGSYAHGEEDAESELDVATILKGSDDYWEQVQRTGPVISELSLEYGVRISPVRVREVGWLQEDSPFLCTVRKERMAL